MGGCGPHVVTVVHKEGVDVPEGERRSVECLNLGKKFPLQAFKAVFVDGKLWLEAGSCELAPIENSRIKSGFVRKPNQPSVLDFFTRKGERKEKIPAGVSGVKGVIKK